MPTFKINDREVSAPDGTTLLAAIRGIGLDVPTLCHRDELEHATSCMLCVVEDLATGRLHPACSTPVRDDMAIATASPAVLDARREALELLLGDHLGDCEGPCHLACPAGLDVPAMLRALATEDFSLASRIVRRDLALPATLGRICAAPCEKACRRGTLDAPVAIRLLHRLAGETPAPAPHGPPAPSGFRVAVVGGGPAGLAAVQALRIEGHACTLFEKDDRLGGGLRAPELHAKLPASVLDAEIDSILHAGVALETGAALGGDLSLDRLVASFDAVVLACGPMDPADAQRLGLDATARGIAVERFTYRTSRPTVFACGAAVTPSHLAVRAVGEGRAAAVAIGQMLLGEAVGGEPRRYQHRVGAGLDRDELGQFIAAGASPEPPVTPVDDATGYDRKGACREAARCLHCECRKPETCQLRRQAEAHGLGPGGWKSADRRRLVIQRQGGIVYEPGKCIACGICVRLTKLHQEPLGLTFVGRGFSVRVGVPFDESLDQALRSVAAACIEACPTGALAFVAGDRRE